MEDIAVLRKARGFTMRTLGEASGVSIKTINGIEAGRANPQPQTMLKLARELQVEVLDIRQFAATLGIGPRQETPDVDMSELTELYTNDQQARDEINKTIRGLKLNRAS